VRIFFYLLITFSSLFYVSLAKADTLLKKPLILDIDSDNHSQKKPNIAEQQSPKIIPSTEEPPDPSSEQNSLIVPSDVNPFSTLIPINGIETNHQSDYGVGTGLTLGDGQSTNIGLNAIKFFSPRLAEKISNQGIYRTEYNNNYVQVGARTQQKDISINFDPPRFLEDSSISPFLGIGRIRQVLVSNGQQSGISRTMRGFNYFFGNQNTLINSSLQLLTEILPNAEPTFAANQSEQPFFVNSNLIQAANNLRLPENSFTSYSAGWGYAKNPTDSQATSPSANYNSIWFGLSPIVNSQTDEFRPDVLFTEKTNYSPHISFSGNTTTVDSVFRYYTGAIFNIGSASDRSQDSSIVSLQDFSAIKAYGGLDFSSTKNNGLSYGAGIIGYTNPDSNNYSRISANVSQQIPLGNNSAHNLSLASGFNYAIDGVSNFNNLIFRPDRSFVNAGATFKIGDLSLGSTYYMPTGLPNSIGSLLSTNISWQAQKNISIAGYYNPINDNTSRSLYGASASLQVGSEPSSPIIKLNWSRNENKLDTDQSVGSDAFGVFLTFGNTLKPTQLGELQFDNRENKFR
jgi:hypothetical protein